MTELIVDAIEFVKNPYKGKKLKVRVELQVLRWGLQGGEPLTVSVLS